MFRKSKIELSAEAEALVAKFVNLGGSIKTYNNTSSAVKTFRSPFSVFNRGAKKCNLRTAGYRG